MTAIAIDAKTLTARLALRFKRAKAPVARKCEECGGNISHHVLHYRRHRDGAVVCKRCAAAEAKATR